MATQIPTMPVHRVKDQHKRLREWEFLEMLEISRHSWFNHLNTLYISEWRIWKGLEENHLVHICFSVIFWHLPGNREAVDSVISYIRLHACVLSCFSHVQLFAALWTAARQAPLSMGFSRHEYWSRRFKCIYSQITGKKHSLLKTLLQHPFSFHSRATVA